MNSFQYLCITSDEVISECSEMTDNIIALGAYTEEEGWSIFNVTTNNKYSNEKQSYFAGYLEGYIYCDKINYHFTNIKDTLYNGQIILSDKAKEYIKTQRDFIASLCEEGQDDYAETMKYVMKQYEGLYKGYCDGYETKGDKTFELISEEEFYYITYLGDLYDVNQAYPKTVSQGNFLFHKECTGYVKYIPSSKELYVAHNTHNIYSMMNRIYKHYDIKLKLKSGSVLNSVKFTSRPGDLNSKDDFYITSAQMAIIETSLEIYNKELYQHLKPNTIPKWLRVNIANRLSQNNQQWIDIFLKMNSGTHNNQWLIIDYKMIEVQSDIISLLEQTANINNKYYKDMTGELLSKGYIGSYNAPYFEEVKKDCGYKDEGDYYHANRYHIIRALDRTITDIKGVKFLIDYHDSVNLCDQIGARCDIGTDNPFGAIDAKITNRTMIGNMQAMIRYGPPYMDGVSLPFKFGSKYRKFSHFGIPEKFEYKWIIS